jgi:outer membrane protein assembly factor BamB
MSAAVIDGRETLVAIRPSDGALFEMRNMRVGHLTVDTDSDVAFTGEWPGGAPTRIDLATGEVTDLAPGAGGTLVGHAFDTTREVIYAITTSTDLMRFPADGSAGSALATGPLPTDSRGGPIAYDAARDRILVASASGAVIAIDPETGAQTTLGSVVLPSGATALLDLAHVPATDTLYALTNAPIGGATSRIAELDPTTLAVRRSFEVAARLETPNPWSGSIATLAPWSP